MWMKQGIEKYGEILENEKERKRRFKKNREERKRLRKEREKRRKEQWREVGNLKR